MMACVRFHVSLGWLMLVREDQIAFSAKGRTLCNCCNSKQMRTLLSRQIIGIDQAHRWNNVRRMLSPAAEESTAIKLML